jgi:hypothetical protein
LLEETGIDPKAKWLIAEGADAPALSRSVPMAKAMDDAMIALYQNGERLMPGNGYPMRLLLPGWEGNMRPVPATGNSARASMVNRSLTSAADLVVEMWNRLSPSLPGLAPGRRRGWASETRSRHGKLGARVDGEPQPDPRRRPRGRNVEQAEPAAARCGSRAAARVGL